MNDPGRLEQLRAIPMLADLPHEALTRLAERASDFEAPAGQVLIQAERARIRCADPGVGSRDR